MSRGLGTSQRLVLRALASLEAEHGAGEGLFYVWAVVDRAFALSPDMQRRHQARAAASDERHARIEAMAAGGNDRAKLYLSLGRGLAVRRPSPRKRRSAPWQESEVTFNPSRVLAGLERRGLVRRDARNGGGSAALTDAGRSEAARLGLDRAA